MKKKPLNKIHGHKSLAAQHPAQPTHTSFSEVDRIILVERDLSTATQLSQLEFENLVEIIRAELKSSLWQGAALSLFMFILGLFATILIILLQR